MAMTVAILLLAFVVELVAATVAAMAVAAAAVLTGKTKKMNRAKQEVPVLTVEIILPV
jgi:hypothetical protein